MIESSEIYFAAATQFTDRFEGAVAVQSSDFPIDPRYARPEPTEQAFEQLRRLTKLNCWHRADYESDEMWKLYASESKGVAVRTTVERMRKAILSFKLAPSYAEETLLGGDVRYVDLLTQRLSVSMQERFFYKHRAFESEREFRLAMSLRMAEEFGVRVPEHGIRVGVDVEGLIETVYLGPALSDEDRDRVLSACEAAGLSSLVLPSSLLGRPRYI